VGSPSALNVSCIDHDVLAAGAQHVVTIKGAGFNPAGAHVSVSGAGVVASHVVVSGTTAMSVLMTVGTKVLPPHAHHDYRDVTVTTGRRTYVCDGCLALGPGPVVTSSSPSKLARGATNKVLRLSGMWLGPNTSVTIPGVTVLTTKFVYPSELD